MSSRARLPWSQAEATCMPIAHAIVNTQQRLQELQTALQQSHAAELAAVARTAASATPTSRSSHSQEDADAEEDSEEGADTQMEEDAMVSAFPRSSSTIRATPLSALPVPPQLTPEVPALLSSLHAHLISLRALLSSLSATDRAGCFDAVFAGPLFTVLVGHPKAAERGRAPQTPGSEGRLALQSFPMLPHQDRVWEETLKCVDCLLQSGIQAPLPFRLGTFPKRFFLLFQQLLHFLPSDFKTSSSQPSGPAAAAALRSSAAASSTAAAAAPADGSRIAVWHSEETRIQAMTCVQTLFLCVEQQLSAGGPSAELAPLLHTLQRDPSFCISLGYYIHLMLRFATKECNRVLRTLAIDSLSTVVRLLQLPALNQPTAAIPPSAAPAVPGRMLLLSYFPGIMSALFNLLIFDSGSAPARSGGWRLQLRALQLFVAVTRAAVQQVATVDDIVREATGAQQAQAAPPDDDLVARDANSIAADEAMAKLRALVPKPSSSPGAAASSSRSSAGGSLPQASQLHPLLQSILKPVDVNWWHEARHNIANIMQRVFTATQLSTHVAMAQVMLTAAETFLLGDDDEDAIRGLNPSLTAHGNTIYTSLLPSACVLTWLEFVILCNEHEDASLQSRAANVVAKIGHKAAGSGWAQQHGQGGLISSDVPSSSSSSAALVPLLTSSLSSHLLRLPRMLPTASEGGQIALLKTVKGYIDVLGRVGSGSDPAAPGEFAGVGGGSNVLYNFLSANMDRVLKIFYKIWEVDTKESKVLDRAEADDRTTSAVTTTDAPATTSEGALVPSSSSSTSLSAPTYYSFSLTHMHSAAAHSLSLSLLRSMGFFLASHFGLFIAHLHDRLQSGMREVSERANYTSSNQLKETLLLINTCVLGLGDAVAQGRVASYEVAPHLELLLSEYLSPTLWHLPRANAARRERDTARSLLSQAELQNNATVVGFLLRGVGDMAAALREDFRPFLMNLLYPLFEKLGSNQAPIRQAALVTLHRVAHYSGYDVEAASLAAAGSNPTPDQVLQCMLVDNMDYLVEQMAVELRTIDLGAGSVAPSAHGGSAHPLTLPLVLSSLLTRISLQCTQALIPLLDDILKVVLDKLGEMSVQHEQQIDVEEEEEEGHWGRLYAANGAISASVSRLAYLEILRSVVTAIHTIQTNQDKLQPHAPIDANSLYSSAAPLPLLAPTPTAGSVPLLQGSSSAAAAAAAAPDFDPDSMLNLEADEVEQKEPPRTPSGDVRMEEKKDDSAAPTAVAAKPALPHFAPQSIRQRLQAALAAKRSEAAQARFESEWLRRNGGASVEEISDVGDVPRDAEGKTSAERWYEEQQALRARQEARKFNTVNGIEDPEAEAEMETEAKAHTDPPEVPLTADQQTTLRIFEQCRNFLSTASGSGAHALAQQYTVLCIVAECIPVLERVPKQFFPEIAKFWPSLRQALRLMDNTAQAAQTARAGKVLPLFPTETSGGAFSNSLVADSASGSAMHSLTSVRVAPEPARDSDVQLTQLISSLSSSVVSGPPSADGSTFTHSTASPLFIQALGVLAQLARSGASKFLSGRFANELWPMLQHILQFEHRWMQQTSAAIRQQRQKRAAMGRTARGAAESASDDAALQLLPAYKVQHALLTCLAELVRFPDLSSLHVQSLADRACPYLSADQPATFQALAVRILQSLAQIDADAVWSSLWALCPSVAIRSHSQRGDGRGPARTGDASPLVDSASFLSHPCFTRVYPNFDARFLLHQRTQPIHRAPANTTAEFDDNVKRVLDSIRALPTLGV